MPPAGGRHWPRKGVAIECDLTIFSAGSRGPGELIASFPCGALRPDGVRRITGTCAKDGARSCKDRSRMRPRDYYGNYVAQRYFVPPHPAFVAMGTDRQMNLSSDRSDHPASWRSGGASTAELAALTAFAADPSLRVIGTTSVKQFGEQRKPPPGAAVHVRGNDSDDGPLLRYHGRCATLL